MHHPTDPITHLLQILGLIPTDGGPVYTETAQATASDFIVEPMNGLSAALFIGVVLFFARRLRGQYRRHKLLTYALPVLGIGALGGTLYHAFRMSRVFLAMDWMPIMILTMAASIYFMWQLLPKWYQVLGVFLACVTFSGVLMVSAVQFGLFPRHYAINVNYGLTALYVLAPIALYLRRRQWAHSRWMLLAAGAFILAWFFRLLDNPSGGMYYPTHALWHTFGALATAFSFELIYRLEPQAHPLFASRHTNALKTSRKPEVTP